MYKELLFTICRTADTNEGAIDDFLDLVSWKIAFATNLLKPSRNKSSSFSGRGNGAQCFTFMIIVMTWVSRNPKGPRPSALDSVIDLSSYVLLPKGVTRIVLTVNFVMHLHSSAQRKICTLDTRGHYMQEEYILALRTR